MLSWYKLLSVIIGCINCLMHLIIDLVFSKDSFINYYARKGRMMFMNRPSMVHHLQTEVDADIFVAFIDIIYIHVSS